MAMGAAAVVGSIIGSIVGGKLHIMCYSFLFSYLHMLSTHSWHECLLQLDFT